jgi:hypothetical protein
VSRSVRAAQIPDRRHCLDGELRHATEIGAVGDADVRVAEVTRTARERLGRNGSVAEREGRVRPQFRVHTDR